MMPISIGIFDSGIGGFSILREIHRDLPYVPIQYFADQVHVPYGPRSMDEIRTFAEGITGFLLSKDAVLIVVACNTASAAALHHLRRTFSDVPFVGMEPAVKPAAQTSRTQKVAVLATPTTFEGKLFASVVERFAQNVEVVELILPGLVELIEAGEIESQETDRILKTALDPVIADGVDTLVLACTHYPFIIPSIKKLFGSEIEVIDPAPAIAKQTRRVLHGLTNDLDRGIPAMINFISSGDLTVLEKMAARLIGVSGNFSGARWEGNMVVGDNP